MGIGEAILAGLIILALCVLIGCTLLAKAICDFVALLRDLNINVNHYDHTKEKMKGDSE